MKKKIIEITSAAAKLIDIVKAMQKKNEEKNSKTPPKIGYFGQCCFGSPTKLSISFKSHY